MDTMIKIGQRVVADMSVQGMVAGRTYEVTEAFVEPSPFGATVVYELDRGICVQNLPLLVRAVV